jgi:hypothetical protein
MKRRFYFFYGLGIYVTVFTAVQLAQGARGESADSITSDHKSLLAVQGATMALDSYTNHTI